MMMTLPELQKSIRDEFDEKFDWIDEYIDDRPEFEHYKDIQSFLRQSLTKAYQLGKENVKCFGCDYVTLPYWCVGCVNKVLNEKDKAYWLGAREGVEAVKVGKMEYNPNYGSAAFANGYNQAIAEMTEKAKKFLS